MVILETAYGHDMVWLRIYSDSTDRCGDFKHEHVLLKREIGPDYLQWLECELEWEF